MQIMRGKTHVGCLHWNGACWTAIIGGQVAAHFDSTHTARAWTIANGMRIADAAAPPPKFRARPKSAKSRTFGQPKSLGAKFHPPPKD